MKLFTQKKKLEDEIHTFWLITLTLTIVNLTQIRRPERFKKFKVKGCRDSVLWIVGTSIVGICMGFLLMHRRLCHCLTSYFKQYQKPPKKTKFGEA